MTPKALTLSKYIVRAGAVLVLAMGASACSSVPDWVDPTTWVGSDSDQAPADQGLPSDQQTADNTTQTPDLSTIPDKPTAPSTADEQKQVADALKADRSKAQYSADALRGGTEPAAAPPPAEAPPASEDLAANDNSTAQPAAPAAPPGPPPPPAAGPGTLPADNTATAQVASPPSAAPAPAVASASMPPPASSGMPAVPAVPAAMPQQQVASSDAALGFRPSSAPPLDASVAQFVPPSIMARYQQTAAISGGMPAVPATGTAYASNGKRSHMGVGGPEHMSGAVVANFDALQGGAVAPGAYIPGGTAAVVFFVHDTTILDSEAKAQVREAAKAFLARGGQGYVRVVGHSASAGGSLSSERQLVWNFERSQARANAVARALIAQGVPADKVLVQAVGDDGSGYSVTAPPGADGGRRADIIFES